MLKNILIAYALLIGYLIPSSIAQNKNVADSLIQLLENKNEFSDSVLYHHYINIAISSNNPNQVLNYGEKAFLLASKLKNFNRMGQSKAMIGNAYTLLGNLVKALSAHFESIDYYEHSKKWNGMATGYNNVGDVYSVQGDPEKAISYYKEAFILFKKAGDNWRLAMLLSNIGYEFYNANKEDSALRYMNQSNKMYDKLDYPIGRAYNNGNIGLIYAKKGEINLGENILKESISTLKKYGDTFAVSEYYTEMANIYKSRGNIKKALIYANKSYNIAMENGLKNQIKGASLKLSELYSISNEYNKAYKYQSIYIIYRDSINNEKVIREMADLRTEYEVSKKQAEVDLLDKKRQNHRIIGAGLILLLTLSSILIYVLSKNNKQKQITNKLLASQKEVLQKQHDELEGLNASKDKLFSIVSHDLRGPISAISGISDIIKQSVECNDMKQLNEFAGYLNLSIDQLSILLDNLLDWAMNQQNEFTFNPEIIHVDSLVREILLIFNTSAKAKNISLIVDIDDNIYLLADKNCLMSIFRNLISNAIKFTYEKGTVEIKGELNKKYAIIKVQDTGIGMSKNKVDNLFNGKKKQSSRGTANEKGLGLGLSLVYEFILMNKGEIFVASEKGKGTIFTFKLPIHQHV